MYEQLVKLNNEKCMVAIYTDENNGDAFSVGYVCDLIQNEVLFLNVGIHGEYDGYTAMHVDDIFRIECNSKYLDKMNKLISFAPREKMVRVKGSDILVFIVEKAIKNNKILAIQYNDDSEIKGYVEKIDDVLYVTEIDEYGYEDGKNLISVNSITRMVLDDVECRDLEKLYQINKKDCR